MPITIASLASATDKYTDGLEKALKAWKNDNVFFF